MSYKPPNELYITQAQLDSLPGGVVRPGESDVNYFNGSEYRQIVYNLINLSIKQLHAIGQYIPNWKAA